jgi:2-polyprenyl-3-methyl-5-hydroxy-6-metoxy-1,4-benzoquinol methylase
MSQKRKPSKPSVFLELGKFPQPARVPFLMDFLQNERFRRLIPMIDFPSNRKCIGLDLGCGAGYLVHHLAQGLNGIMIGTDENKDYLLSAKRRAHLSGLENIEYIRCDISCLPFKRDSIDLVVCSSVLEHIYNLEGAIKGIELSMSKKGSFIAGYPIETRLFNAILKLFAPYSLIIRDQRILGEEKFRKDPETHKQSYMTIRSLLQVHFLMAQKKKLFFSILPDTLSWYECVKVNKS